MANTCNHTPISYFLFSFLLFSIFLFFSFSFSTVCFLHTYGVPLLSLDHFFNCDKRFIIKIPFPCAETKKILLAYTDKCDIQMKVSNDLQLKFFHCEILLFLFLTFVSWFHNPCAGRILSKFFHKKIIISRQNKSHRNKICNVKKNK